MVTDINTTPILQACNYASIPSNTHVFNKYEIDKYVWIKLPDCMPSSYKLYDIWEIVPNKSVVKYEDNMCRDCNRLWLKVNTSIISLDSGIHIYQLKFVDVYTDNIYLLYVGYIIQDNNPDKPYIYMKETKH